MRKAALVMDQTVVPATPVDTGRARSNYIITYGEPANFSRAAGIDPSGQASLDDASKLGEYTLDKGSIFITNNLTYIVPLEDGHSPQNRDMAKKAIVAGAAAVRGA